MDYWPLLLDYAGTRDGDHLCGLVSLLILLLFLKGCENVLEINTMYTFAKITYETRMHSSRMRTARSLAVFPGSLSSLGGGGGDFRWGCG